MARHKATFPDFKRLSANVWFLDQSRDTKQTNGEDRSSSDSITSNGHVTSTKATNGSITATTTALAPTGAPARQQHQHEQPDLVILATWMGADARHISKYVVGYRQLFPESSFLIIRNGIADVTYRPRRLMMHRIQPVLETIERFVAAAAASGPAVQQNGKVTRNGSANGDYRRAVAADSSPNIMLHMYSNGGANQARLLAQLWRRKYGTPLPVSSMVFDSCPGIEKYRTTLAAFIVALPKFFLLRYILLPFIHMVLMAHYVANHYLGAVSFLRMLRRHLNDETLFPTSASRCYIYSKRDEMVEWRDVESHAEDARLRGWNVKTDRFDSSKHVGHLIADKERYWGDVQGLV